MFTSPDNVRLAGKPAGFKKKKHEKTNPATRGACSAGAARRMRRKRGSSRREFAAIWEGERWRNQSSVHGPGMYSQWTIFLSNFRNDVLASLVAIMNQIRRRREDRVS